MTLKAAGILFKTPEGLALFVKRSGLGDHPGEWCFPGGKVEEGETAEIAALRESTEEVGVAPEETPPLLSRSISNPELAAIPPALAEAAPGTVALPPRGAPDAVSVDFSTFLALVDEPFLPKVPFPNDEHVAYCWAPANNPPEPLHPGCRIALARLSMDELGIARAMAAGELTSPQRYKNVTLWAMRITGTGVAMRRAVKDAKGKVIRGSDEFPFRDPAHYMTEDFLARCNGLPVIWRHPEKALLDSKEYGERVAGSIFLPYLRPDLEEVWGIAKIYDDEANAAMGEAQLSTSPCVTLSDPESPSYKLVTEAGDVLLIEGKPSLLDHLAICERGVWDKGGEPAGITNHELEQKELIMADEDKKPDAEKDVKGDATLDKVLSCMDSIMSRMDAFEDKFSKKDSDEEKEKKADGEKKDGDAEDVVADKKADEKEEKAEKADADKEEMKDDAARADAAAARSEAAELRRVVESLASRVPVERTDSDVRTMTAIQVRADSVYSLFGKQAPRFLNGEEAPAYRRRMLRDFQEHSAAWKPVDLGTLQDSVLSVAEDAIYADAAIAAMNPKGFEDGGLRMVSGNTPSGHREVKFYGRPRDWMGRFAGSKRFATKINPLVRQEMN